MSKDNGKDNDKIIEIVQAEVVEAKEDASIDEKVQGNIKLTPEMADEIVDYVKAGNYAKTICAMVGVTEPTYYNWHKRAKAQEEPFLSLFSRIEVAKAEAEASMVLELRKAAKQSRNWGALKFLLERTRPENFASKNLELIGGLKDKPIEVLIKIEDVYGNSKKDKDSKMARKKSKH